MTRPAFEKMRSFVVYNDPARPALIKLKYRREQGLGEALAWNLALYLDELNWSVDLVLPVPLSKQRILERGYNQVDLIAHPLAELHGLHYTSKGLQRVRHTNSQVGLGYAARAQNVKDAFLATSHIVSGKKILLVDDITTTGATIDSASNALMKAGAQKVFALTFAKAVKL